MVGMMVTTNPAKPRCRAGCETYLANSSTGKAFCADCGHPPVPKPDHTDELGKVWDVLHANGINGTGALSASEGVKLLANKVKPPLKQCRDGYGHAGTWCGPEYQCWLDPRSKGERKGYPKNCPCRECSQ